MDISVGLRDDSNLFVWDVFFQGPPSTEGGFFKAELIFPRDFPNNPPIMKFISTMWHPNIYNDGTVCISILHAPGVDIFNEQEKAEERWRPIISIEAILISVISMLSDPNDSSPANIDAAKEWRDNKESYKKRVRQLVLKTQDEL